MPRLPLVRALGACFAIWFGLATGEYGLANACWAATPPSQHAGHHTHGASAPESVPAAPEHSAHGNCLSHCAGVVGYSPAPAMAPAGRAPAESRDVVVPVSDELPGTPAADHPFANGPPPSAV